MEQVERNIDGRDYAWYTAHWQRHRSIAIIQLICSDGRMLRLCVSGASRKWCKFYKQTIKEYFQPTIRAIVQDVKEWERLTVWCSVGDMQGEIDKWQQVTEAN